MQKHEDWLFIAHEDFLSARLLKDGERFANALYHAQQCAEKALKGYLAFQKCPIKKIHDLDALIQDCGCFDPSFLSLLPQAKSLKPYITQSRYPDDYIEVDEAETMRGLKNAAEILNFVKQRISSPLNEFQLTIN